MTLEQFKLNMLHQLPGPAVGDVHRPEWQRYVRSLNAWRRWAARK